MARPGKRRRGQQYSSGVNGQVPVGAKTLRDQEERRSKKRKYRGCRRTWGFSYNSVT